jgi:signal transduction histidine kinase
MNSPDFENCQIALDFESGKVIRISDEAKNWLGDSLEKKNLYYELINLFPGWANLLPEKLQKSKLGIFLPLEMNSYGIFASVVPYEENGITVVSFSHALAPHDSLKDAFLGDMMKNPKSIASTLIRLQKAENRLDSYLNNFPGIFFSQRIDLSFSFLSRGIRKIFPEEYKFFSLNGSVYLEKIVEQDREYFQKEIFRNSKSSATFSLNYRIRLEKSNQIIYLLDIRTPIKAQGGKVLGFDGVLIDVTRQAIAEHRLSSSVWREGLTTLTNGLVHDFSNLMAGIFSISELYHGMMEKDDPMKNGIGQIKKSSMQAQQLVRRIIDLHREKPSNKIVQDLRMLLKDQMDLLQILIPRGTKIKTDFGKETIPALIEETGFRQVVLNLAINAKDAVEKNGEIKISIYKVRKGEVLIRKRKDTKVSDQEGAVILFSDNGCGIPLEVGEKIFDPFFTTKESRGGSGFGLYNAKIFVEDHNGKIGFVSDKNKGTTFYVFIPIADTEDYGSSRTQNKTIRKANKEFLKSRKPNFKE